MREVLQRIINGWRAEEMTVRRALESAQQDLDVLRHALDRLYHATAEQQHTLASLGWNWAPEGRWSKAGAQWHQYQEVEGAVLDARTVLEQVHAGDATKQIIERMQEAEARAAKAEAEREAERDEAWDVAKQCDIRA